MQWTTMKFFEFKKKKKNEDENGKRCTFSTIYIQLPELKIEQLF